MGEEVITKKLEEDLADYLERRKELSAIEASMSEIIGADQRYTKRLADLYHALQHYDVDIQSLGSSSKEYETMKNKMSRIVSAVMGDDQESFDSAIQDFFKNPLFWKLRAVLSRRAEGV